MKNIVITILVLVAIVAVGVLFVPSSPQSDVILPSYIFVHPDIQITDREQRMIEAYDAIRYDAQTASEQDLVNNFVFEREYTKQLFLAEGSFSDRREAYETEKKQEECAARYSRSQVDIPCRNRSLFPPLLGLYDEEVMTLVAVDGSDLWFAETTEGRSNDTPMYGQVVYRIPFQESDNGWKIMISSTADPYNVGYYDVGSEKPPSIDKARERALVMIGS